MPAVAKPAIVAVSPKEKLAKKQRKTTAMYDPTTGQIRSERKSAEKPRRPMKPPQKNITMTRIAKAAALSWRLGFDSGIGG